MAAGMIDPGDSNPVANMEAVCVFPVFFNPADYLMAEHNWQVGRGCPSFDLIQFGVTHPAGTDFHQDFVGVGNG